MRIAVLGTGSAGRTLAEGLTRIGHEVTIGTRDPAVSAGREDFARWVSDWSSVKLATFAEAAEEAELVVNAGSGDATLTMIKAAGVDNLAGKVLIDAANPLDSSAGFPPTLLVKDTDSLAEQVQRAAPDAKVVKTFNTVTAAVMVQPGLLGNGDTSIFVAGNDAEAKATVVALLEDLGWRDVIDLGDLSGARGMEMWLPLWIRLMVTLGTSQFNLKVVR
jgi:predicted dinucleotide-binding enzyme